MSGIHCRPAEVRDVEAIAALHADSWRRNYRGAYLDSYLDGDVVTDRLVVWHERITRPDANFRTIVAEHDGAFAGFAHLNLDDDPTWGALLENLHVMHQLKGQGIGTQLMAASARAVLDSTPGAGLYLWVLDQMGARPERCRAGLLRGPRRRGSRPRGARAVPGRRHGAWPPDRVARPLDVATRLSAPRRLLPPHARERRSRRREDTSPGSRAPRSTTSGHWSATTCPGGGIGCAWIVYCSNGIPIGDAKSSLDLAGAVRAGL